MKNTKEQDRAIQDSIRDRAAGEPAPAGDEERALVARARNGDREAFERLVYKYDRQILRLALYTLGGDREQAREAYQETFLKAYRSIKRFRGESSFYTWIHRIAKNVCVDYQRKGRWLGREVPIDVTGETDPGGPSLINFLRSTAPDGDPERSLHATEIGNAVRSALGKLSGKERMVFELRHYQGLRIRAVGEVAGMTEETAKNYLFRGTKKLRTALAQFRAAGAA